MNADGEPTRLARSIARLDARPAPAYLAPVQELDRLRAELASTIEDRDEFEKSYVHFHAAYEQAEARVDQLTDTLALRSDALNRTGESNDQLRATLARVEKAANHLGSSFDPSHYARGQRDACVVIREALADQEPTP